MQDSKLQKLKELLNIIQEGITRDEFVSAFKKVIEQVKSLEGKTLEKVDVRVSEALDGVWELRTRMEGILDEVEQSKEQYEEKAEDILKELEKNTSSTFIAAKARAMEAVDALFSRLRIEQKFDTMVQTYEAKIQDLSGEIESLPSVPTAEEIAAKVVIHTDTPQSVRDKIESLEGGDRLDINSLKGVDEFKKIVGSGAPRSLFGQSRGVTVYTDGTKRVLTKDLNIAAGTNVTVAHTSENGLATVTINATGNGFFRGEDYGADPAETATTNTTAIQAALDAANTAGGGTVTITTPGIYTINASSIIYSDTKFSLSPGVTIKRDASMNACILKNAAFVNHIAGSRTTITIAWTAGALATVTWTGHGLTSEDYIWIQGASSSIYNNVFRVADVVDANTFIILLTRVPTASPTGTITALQCDRNIEIEGGNWDGNQLNNQAASGYDRDNWVLIGLGHSRFSRYSHRGFHRGITSGALGDCQFSFADSVCSDADIAAALNSEGHKLFGPLNGVRVYDAEYRAADDGTSLQVKEAPAFSWTGIPFGDIHDVTLENVRAISRGLSAAAGIVVYNSDSETYSKIRFKNVTSHSESGSGLSIKYGDTFTTGVVDDIEIDSAMLSTATPTTQYGFYVSVPFRKVTLKDVKINQGSGTQGTLRMISTATGGILTVDGLTFNDTSFPSSVANLFTLSGTLDKFVLKNSRITANQSTMTVIAPTAAIDNIELHNNAINGVAKVINENTGTIANLLMQGNVFENMAIVYEPRSASVVTNVSCFGNNFNTVTTGVIRPSTGTGLVARVYGSGNTFTSATFVAATGSATWGAYSTDISANPTTVTGIDTTTGQYLTSTEAGTSAGFSTRASTGWVSVGNLQALDTDLTTIAGLTATTDNFIQSKSSAWASRTPTQVTADLIAVVGDSGSGGTKGLVPAPAAGDAAASKFLKADGTWVTPTGSGDVSKVGTPVNNQVGVWTGDGTLEGDTALTFDTTTDTLATGTVTVTDDPYGAGWNGSTAVPTKNAVYDKIETLGGGGTVTATGGSLTANSVVLGAGTTDTKVVAGITTDGTSVLNLGVNTTTLGKVKMFGNTSGDATIQPAAVAGTATVLTLPATTDTIVGKATTDTLTNKTYDTAGTGNSFSINSVAVTANTGTGAVARETSPTFVTPTLGVASATSLATSAATPLKLTNGQLVDIALTSQTVGATTLTIPDFASVVDEFTFKTKAQTMSNKTFVAPALGTPVSGTLTNCTGLPVNGIVDDTTSALGVGTLELGHASDTTIARSGAGAITVEGVAVLLSGGALGTPSSGTLTNATGLPLAGVVDSTTEALGVGSLELGHASDTTLTRVSAGVAAIEGVNIETTTTTANTKIATLSFIIDGGGSTITTGVKGDLEIPFACTINTATLLADQSGSIVVDVWKDTYANYPATDADSITASAPPTISTATKSQDSTLTGWTTSIAAGDILRFNVDSVTTCTRVLVSLKVTKT